MKAIRLFPLNKILPATVLFDFHNMKNHIVESRERNDFSFRKYPMSIAEYNLAFEPVQKQIQAGNSFLTNLTFPTIIETDLTFREIFFNRNDSLSFFQTIYQNHLMY